MSVTAPDLTTTPPRSGRAMLGRYSWLARLADKVRRDAANRYVLEERKLHLDEQTPKKVAAKERSTGCENPLRHP